MLSPEAPFWGRRSLCRAMNSLDLRSDAELAPVRRDRPNAMRADRDYLLHLRGLEGLQPRFGEVLEDQVIAQPPRRITRAFLLLKHAETCAQMPHHPREIGDDLAPARVI